MKKIVEDEGGETQQSCRVPGQSQTASLRLSPTFTALLHLHQKCTTPKIVINLRKASTAGMESEKT